MSKMMFPRHPIRHPIRHSNPRSKSLLVDFRLLHCPPRFIVIVDKMCLQWPRFYNNFDKICLSNISTPCVCTSRKKHKTESTHRPNYKAQRAKHKDKAPDPVSLSHLKYTSHGGLSQEARRWFLSVHFNPHWSQIGWKTPTFGGAYNKPSKNSKTCFEGFLVLAAPPEVHVISIKMSLPQVVAGVKNSGGGAWRNTWRRGKYASINIITRSLRNPFIVALCWMF